MKDPLESSLAAAPMMDPDDRRVLWDKMLDCEKDDPLTFISGWFFDQPAELISRHDICDFICWSLFDGRNQEHLTTAELHELEMLVEDLEMVISVKMYGCIDEQQMKSQNKENNEKTGCKKDDDKECHNDCKKGTAKEDDQSHDLFSKRKDSICSQKACY